LVISPSFSCVTPFQSDAVIFWFSSPIQVCGQVLICMDFLGSYRAGLSCLVL
jgi:hypothetical protein